MPYILSPFILLFFLCSCKTSESSLQGPATIEGFRWDLVEINDSKAVLEDLETGVFLDIAKDGKVAGFAGCNRINTSVRTEGKEIDFDPVGTTRRYCPDVQVVEQYVLEALRTAERYRLVDKRFYLYSKGDVKLKFELY